MSTSSLPSSDANLEEENQSTLILESVKELARIHRLLTRLLGYPAERMAE